MTREPERSLTLRHPREIRQNSAVRRCAPSRFDLFSDNSGSFANVPGFTPSTDALGSG